MVHSLLLNVRLFTLETNCSMEFNICRKTIRSTSRITTFLVQTRHYEIYQPQYAAWVLHCGCKPERMNNTRSWCDRLWCVSTELECSHAFKIQLFHINKRQNFGIDIYLTASNIFIVSGTRVPLPLVKLFSRLFELYIYTNETPQNKMSWPCFHYVCHGMDMQSKNKRNLNN